MQTSTSQPVRKVKKCAEIDLDNVVESDIPGNLFLQLAFIFQAAEHTYDGVMLICDPTFKYERLFCIQAIGEYAEKINTVEGRREIVYILDVVFRAINTPADYGKIELLDTNLLHTAFKCLAERATLPDMPVEKISFCTKAGRFFQRLIGKNA